MTDLVLAAAIGQITAAVAPHTRSPECVITDEIADGVRTFTLIVRSPALALSQPDLGSPPVEGEPAVVAKPKPAKPVKKTAKKG